MIGNWWVNKVNTAENTKKDRRVYQFTFESNTAPQVCLLGPGPKSTYYVWVEENDPKKPMMYLILHILALLQLHEFCMILRIYSNHNQSCSQISIAVDGPLDDLVSHQSDLITTWVTHM